MSGSAPLPWAETALPNAVKGSVILHVAVLQTCTPQPFQATQLGQDVKGCLSMLAHPMLRDWTHNMPDLHM